MGWEKQGLAKSWRCFFCNDIIKGFFTWLTTFGQREGKLSRSNIVYIIKIRWRIAPLQCSERTGNQWRRLLREIYFRVQNLQHMTFWWLAWTLYQQTIGFSWSLELIALRSLHHMITKLRDMSSEARAKHTLFFCIVSYATQFLGTSSTFPLIDFGVLEKDSPWIPEDLCWTCAAFCWDNVLNLGRASGLSGLVITIVLSINRSSHSDDQFDDRGQDLRFKTQPEPLFIFLFKKTKGGSIRRVGLLDQEPKEK